MVCEILATPISAPRKSPIMYEISKKATIHNTALLKKFDCNVFKVLAAYPHSELSYGSEFCPISSLKKLLYLRKN